MKVTLTFVSVLKTPHSHLHGLVAHDTWIVTNAYVCVLYQVLVAVRGFVSHSDQKGCCYFRAQVREVLSFDH